MPTIRWLSAVAAILCVSSASLSAGDEDGQEHARSLLEESLSTLPGHSRPVYEAACRKLKGRDLEKDFPVFASEIDALCRHNRTMASRSNTVPEIEALVHLMQHFLLGLRTLDSPGPGEQVAQKALDRISTLGEKHDLLLNRRFTEPLLRAYLQIRQGQRPRLAWTECFIRIVEWIEVNPKTLADNPHRAGFITPAGMKKFLAATVELYGSESVTARLPDRFRIAVIDDPKMRSAAFVTHLGQMYFNRPYVSKMDQAALDCLWSNELTHQLFHQLKTDAWDGRALEAFKDFDFKDHSQGEQLLSDLVSMHTNDDFISVMIHAASNNRILNDSSRPSMMFALTAAGVKASEYAGKSLADAREQVRQKVDLQHVKETYMTLGRKVIRFLVQRGQISTR
jgi:hypothetical protein